MGKSKSKKKEAEQKLQQEQEGQKAFLQTPRESAPSPEPVPASMEVTHQQTLDQGRVSSWEQYANCNSLSQFRDLSPSNKNPSSFHKVTEQNLDKAKQDLTNVMANDPKLKGSFQPIKPTYAGNVDFVLDSSPKEYQPVFGQPSPLRHGPKAPLWVRADVETTEFTPCPKLSLDDLHSEQLEKRLQTSIEPSTMSLAASVVLHLVNEAGYQWFNRWCPGMDLREVFETISVKDKASQLADKRYNVPPEAIDTHVMMTSLAGMYRRCHDVHPKDSEVIQFPKLLKLIDECVVFLRALKETKHKTLLQKTKSMFQWIPIGLDAKKLVILKRARADLEELNRLYKHAIGNTNVEYDNLKRKHQERQLSILDEANTELDIHRKTFETDMLDWLNVLLASTDNSPPKPNILEEH
ncbi:hypothetical protein F4782DRAFT_527609 [Xylaria castorea]|nr:hypothetical protein F4782DRAFT_527609 [Xylaria castorea]